VILKAANTNGPGTASNMVEGTPKAPPSGNSNVLLIGDSSISTVSTALASAKTALGYGGTMNITTQDLNNYNGATPVALSSYNAVILFINGGFTLNSSLGTALNTYVSGGNPLIMMSFSWGNVSAIPNFTYGSYSTYVHTSNANVYESASSLTYASHPITDGMPTSLTSGSVATINPTTLTSGASAIASFPSGKSFIAVKTAGSAKLIGINAYPSSTDIVMMKFVVKSIYWCKGYLT